MSKTNLIPHEAKHAHYFVCSSCDKSFETLSKLSCHMVVHDKSRCVRCETCGKEFSRKYTNRKGKTIWNDILILLIILFSFSFLV